MPVVIAGIAIVAGGLLLAGLAVWIVDKLDLTGAGAEALVCLFLLIAMFVGFAASLWGLVDLLRYVELHLEMEARQ
jgi:hypothetical protein